MYPVGIRVTIQKTMMVIGIIFYNGPNSKRQAVRCGTSSAAKNEMFRQHVHVIPESICRFHTSACGGLFGQLRCESKKVCRHYILASAWVQRV